MRRLLFFYTVHLGFLGGLAWRPPKESRISNGKIIPARKENLWMPNATRKRIGSIVGRTAIQQTEIAHQLAQTRW
jgi:hypothetical protein